MDINTRLNAEMVIAAKARDKVRLSVIRMLKLRYIIKKLT